MLIVLKMDLNVMQLIININNGGYEELVFIYDNDVVPCKLLRTTDNGRNSFLNKVGRTEKYDCQSARLGHVLAQSCSLG